jgi:hypothetical protein
MSDNQLPQLLEKKSEPLQAKYVIHVQGPTWKVGASSDNVAMQLVQAVGGSGFYEFEI